MSILYSRPTLQKPANIDKNPKSLLLLGEAHQNKKDPIYPPQDSPIHIQLPQPVTDTYKLVYISHQARGDSNSGEHSPADSQGVDIHPGPAIRKACSLEHLDVEAVGGPELREHSPAKFSGTTLPGPAHSSKDSIAHKENPAHGGPDSRDHSTAKSFRGVDSSIAHRTTHRVAHKDNPAHGGPDSRDFSTAHPSGLTNPSDPTELNKKVTTLHEQDYLCVQLYVWFYVQYYYQHP